MTLKEGYKLSAFWCSVLGGAAFAASSGDIIAVGIALALSGVLFFVLSHLG
jgi:predicted phage tail protein